MKPQLLIFNNDINQPLIIKVEDVYGDIDIQKILEAMNERIEYIYDREHTIGHSYFMPLIKEPTKAKLDEIFIVNIIPLLAEYFYGDWGDIQFVLNNNFIEEKKVKTYVMDNSRRQLNKVYKIATKLESCEYMKIYNGFFEQENSSTENAQKDVG